MSRTNVMSRTDTRSSNVSPEKSPLADVELAGERLSDPAGTWRLINGVLCVAGLTVLTFLLGCQGSDVPSLSDSASEKQKNQNGGIVDTIKSRQVNGLQNAIPDDVDGLMIFLTRRGNEMKQVTDLKEQVILQRQRAVAADKLLSKKLNKEQRFEAVRIRLDSLLRLIGMGDAEANVAFHSVVADYQNDSQPRIAQATAVSNLVLEYTKQAQAKKPNMNPVLKNARTITERFPESFDVCKEVSNLSERILTSGDRETWMQMTQVLVNSYGNSFDPKIMSFITSLKSRLYIAQMNLDVVVNRIHHKEEGAIDSFRKTVNEVFSDSNVNPELVNQVQKALVWLEQTGMVQETLEANQIVTTASRRLPASIRTIVDKPCAMRSKRLGRVGQPFFVQFRSANGDVKWASFSEDAPVIVVFWSARQPSSIEKVKQLAGIFETHKSQGLKLLSIDITGESTTNNYAEQDPGWEFASTSHIFGSGPDPIIDSFGIEKFPHVMLIDRQGNTIAVNPPPATLADAVSRLIE